MKLQNKQLYILLGIAGILVLIVIIAAITSFFSSPPPQNEQGLITPTTSPGSYNENPEGAFRFTPLQKTEVGVTTAREIEAKETVISKSIQNGITIYQVESAIPGENDEIRVRDNTVIFESINTFNLEEGTPPKIKTYQDEFGQPEKTIDGVSSLGKHISASIYAEQGFSLFVNRFTNTIYKIHRYVPMSTAEYERQYAEYLQPAPEYPQESPN